jgi:hypothetical protein
MIEIEEEQAILSLDPKELNTESFVDLIKRHQKCQDQKERSEIQNEISEVLKKDKSLSTKSYSGVTPLSAAITNCKETNFSHSSKQRPDQLQLIYLLIENGAKIDFNALEMLLTNNIFSDKLLQYFINGDGECKRDENFFSALPIVLDHYNTMPNRRGSWSVSNYCPEIEDLVPLILDTKDFCKRLPQSILEHKSFRKNIGEILCVAVEEGQKPLDKRGPLASLFGRDSIESKKRPKMLLDTTTSDGNNLFHWMLEAGRSHPSDPDSFFQWALTKFSSSKPIMDLLNHKNLNNDTPIDIIFQLPSPIEASNGYYRSALESNNQPDKDDTVEVELFVELFKRLAYYNQNSTIKDLQRYLATFRTQYVNIFALERSIVAFARLDEIFLEQIKKLSKPILSLIHSNKGKLSKLGASNLGPLKTIEEFLSFRELDVKGLTFKRKFGARSRRRQMLCN